MAVIDNETSAKDWIKASENEEEKGKLLFCLYTDKGPSGGTIVNIGYGINLNEPKNLEMVLSTVEFYYLDPKTRNVNYSKRASKQEVLEEIKRIRDKPEHFNLIKKARKNCLMMARSEQVDKVFDILFKDKIEFVKNWYNNNSDVMPTLSLHGKAHNEIANPTWDDLIRGRPNLQYAIVDIAYNGGLYDFKSLKASLKIGDFRWAIKECRHTKSEKKYLGRTVKRGDTRVKIIEEYISEVRWQGSRLP